MESTINMSLDAMAEGIASRIAAIQAPPTEIDRLEVMGLCVGRTVEVVKSGDPMIVRVLGTRLGLAAVLARTVLVEAEPAG